MNLPERWKPTEEGNKGNGRDDQHSNYNNLQGTHDSIYLTTSISCHFFSKVAVDRQCMREQLAPDAGPNHE